MSKIIFFLVVSAFIVSTSTLRLHLASPILYVDNLAQSNQNYYFGSMSVIKYYDSITKYMSANPLAQNCPPSIPYANYSNGNLSCFACAKIQQGMNATTAKVLFDVQTRKCQPCSLGKTAICDKLLTGSYIFTNPSASTNRSLNASSTTSNINSTNITSINATNLTNTSLLVNSSNVTNISKIINSSNLSSINHTNVTANVTNITANVTNVTVNGTNVTANASSVNVSGNSSLNTTNVTNVTLVHNANNLTNATHNVSANVSHNVSANISHNVSANASLNSTLNASNITNVSHIVNVNNATNLTNATNATNASNAKVKAKHFGCPVSRPLYDPATGLCNTCKPNLQYSNALQKCIPIIYATNPQAKGLILSNLSQLQTVNAQLQKNNPTEPIQYCPLNKPYSQNNVCISCSSGQYFLVSTGLCVYGCPNGYTYDPRVFKCMPSLYYTDVNAAYLVSQLGDYKAWRAKTQARAASSPLMTACPISTPY